MTGRKYDVIVVGARCAGSPTATLLARAGYDVLLVDRTTFPSDTVSTHIVHPPGVAALDRWGVLDDLVASGCPPIDRYVFDFGPITIAGHPGTEGSEVAYCPRRTVLDTLLVEHAAAAGVEVREGFGVDALLFDGDAVAGIRGKQKNGTTTEEHARVVVGADGLKSFVARSVGAEEYDQRPRQLCGYYSYWSDLPMEGAFEVYTRGDRGFAAAPTNDGLTLVVGGWPFAEYEANRHDIAGHYLEMFDRAPEFAERLSRAHQETRVIGTAVPNFFRKPFGPGWALVGDAGYTRDFITAQGIMDAFRDAEVCAQAIDDAFSGRREYADAMRDYQRQRDELVFPMYEFTIMLASFQEPPPEMQQLLAAVSTNQDAMDQFARVNAGSLSPADFFAEENIGRILATA